MIINKIDLFDFDGTMFASPEEPTDYAGPYWFGSYESLNPPCVPQEPNSEWWNQDTVARALESTEDDKVLSVLLTGRGADETNFVERIEELLNQQGLHFDYIKLRPGGHTDVWKLNTLFDLLELYPEVQHVEIWDDRLHHLEYFEENLQDSGLNVIYNHVETPAMGCASTATRRNHDGDLIWPWNMDRDFFLKNKQPTVPDAERWYPEGESSGVDMVASFQAEWPAEIFVQSIDAVGDGKLRDDWSWVGKLNNVYLYMRSDDNKTNLVWLHDIIAEKPGEGKGTQVLAKLTKLADDLGVVLKLEADPLSSGFMSLRELKIFYGRFGFKSRRGNMMQRRPR